MEVDSYEWTYLLLFIELLPLKRIFTKETLLSVTQVHKSGGKNLALVDMSMIL